MATFFMVGRYSVDAFKEMNPERTDKALALLKELGGKIQSTYALLGEQDLVFIVDLPGIPQAIKA
ncbi:MAG: GYD domain-containing protein, partial [Bacteroidetes bacterium]|nr:GYD domain-containing protein [Bacteroidota bacterium]